MGSPERAGLRAALGVALAFATLAGCKTPRSPREHADGDVTGRWAAESAASGKEAEGGTLRWRLEVEQHPAGRLFGEGTMEREGRTATFPVRGVRDRHQVDLRFALPGGAAMYHGGIIDMKTIVGELYLERDTIPVSFTREGSR